MKLSATKSLRYAGKDLHVGDEFEATDRDGRVLKAIGKAADVVPAEAAPENEPPAAANRTGYQTRRMKAKD